MKANEIPILIVSLLAPLLAGALGGLATASAIPAWYATLNKPTWNPPNWLFGPVWTALYILMGVALFLVWRQGWDQTAVRTAVTLFAVQLALNVLWSVIFFGLRSPGGGVIEIIVLWLLITATTIAFFRSSALSGILMLPYIAWVTFAGVLNGAIWALNR